MADDTPVSAPQGEQPERATEQPTDSENKSEDVTLSEDKPAGKHRLIDIKLSFCDSIFQRCPPVGTSCFCATPLTRCFFQRLKLRPTRRRTLKLSLISLLPLMRLLRPRPMAKPPRLHLPMWRPLRPRRPTEPLPQRRNPPRIAGPPLVPPRS